MKYKTIQILMVAFFSALTAIGAFITIPLPYIPITLQNLFCIMSGLILGPKLGMLSQIIYIFLGLCGLPIFAGGHGGFSSLLTPSFGYLIGFIFASYASGKIFFLLKKTNILNLFISTFSGMIVVYLFGLPYLYFILRFFLNIPKSIGWIITNGFIIFILGDLIKCILISLLCVKVLPQLKKLGFHF